MYSLQNRTKHEVWREMGHGNNMKQSCFGLQQQRTAVPLIWPVITRMRAPQGCWKSTPRFASEFGFPMIPPQHPTTSHNPNAKWCQMMSNAKASKDHFACWTHADQSRFCHICYASLSFHSLRAVQTLSDLCWSDWSVISAQNWPISTHPGTLITAFEIPLWPWWSSANAALHSDEETFTIEKTTLLSEIILTSNSPPRIPSMLTTALGISYVFGDT